MILKTFFISLIVFASMPLLAKSFKVRAREHFEVHQIELSGKNHKYQGASNTINMWYEVPMKWSFGLGFSPLLGGAKNQESVLNTQLGSKIKLLTVNLELKYYPVDSFGLFVRPGFGWAQLDPDGTLDKLSGTNFYGGVGYEWLLNMFGLALEIAYRQSELSDDVKIKTTTPSIGFHFYKYL